MRVFAACDTRTPGVAAVARFGLVNAGVPASDPASLRLKARLVDALTGMSSPAIIFNRRDQQ